MSFSGTTVEQRSKEVEALKSFLTYSLIGSLALHIGVLSSGIGNYLTRVPTNEDEPIEVAIIDTPTPEPEKPLEKITEEPKKEPEIVQKQPKEIPPVQKPVQELIERPKIQPVQQQAKQTTQIQPVQQPKQTTQNPQPTNREIAPKSQVPVTTVAPVIGGGGGGGGSPVLTDNSGSSGSGVALNTGSGSGTGSGIGSGIGSGSGSGRGSGIGSGSGSGIGNGLGNRPTVATAPTVPTPPKINSSSNGNGRADCRKCGFKYPESFKRRGIEGRVGLAFDTDEQGNVTNVRVASSSGNRELDEENLRQAREWKFNPAQGGRQGVRVNSGAFKEDSQQYRQYQQQRKKEAEERTQQAAAAAAANSIQEHPGRRRRELTPSSNEATATRPAISGLSRRLEPQRREIITAGSSSETRINRTQGSARDSLRSIQRQRATTNSSQQPQATPTRRRRAENTSQDKLRESLRRLRPQPQSQPAAPSQP